MLFLNNVAVLDAYDASTTVGPVQQAKSISVLVANAAVYCQVMKKTPSGSEQPWGEELLISPSQFTVVDAQGIRFRNAVGGTAARVVVALSEPNDAVLQGATAFSQVLSASGAIGQTTVITPTPLASWPPASPADGQLAILELPTSYDPINAKKIRWLFSYNSGDVCWDFLGGPPLYARVDTQEGTASTVYADLATVGPSITAPLKGDYEVAIGYRGATTNVGCAMSFAVGAVAASDTDRCSIFGASATNNFGSPVANRTKSALALDAIVAKYKNEAAGTGTFGNRWMALTPVRLT